MQLKLLYILMNLKNKIKKFNASRIPISSFFFNEESKKTIRLIENGIYLKISNAIVFSYLEKKYLMSRFIKDLHKLAKLSNMSKEVIKYVFTEQRQKLTAIRKTVSYWHNMKRSKKRWRKTTCMQVKLSWYYQTE